MPRPVIFISAVNSELQSTRFIVANALTALGYTPRWHDFPASETNDQKAALRRRVDQSRAVVQIVGHSYGPSPTEPDEEFGRVSYAMYEALYAHSKGKPIWYIVLDITHLIDRESTESEELRELQIDYRANVEKHTELCSRSDFPGTTRNIALKLCNNFSEIRRSNPRKRAVALIAIFLLILSGVFWISLNQGKPNDSVVTSHTAEEEITREDAAVPEVAVPEDKSPEVTAPEDTVIAETAQEETAQEEIAQEEIAMEENAVAKTAVNESTEEEAGGNSNSVHSSLTKMEKVLFALADAENRSRVAGEKLTPDELRARAYRLLESEHDLTPDTLADSLPSFALDIYTNLDTGLAMKASAAYALNRFEEAERLFLRVETYDKDSIGKSENGDADPRAKRIQSLEGAAQFASARAQFSRAAEHYRAAAALTSVEHDPLEWVRIRHMLAYALASNGQHPDAAETLMQVIPVCEKHLGAEHSDTLSSSNNLANSLNAQGKHSEAEERHRAILAIRMRVLGAGHPDTLTSRNNLAATLGFEGKHREAEEQHRAVLAIRQRNLAAQHPDILFSRNNLANTLKAQGKHAEAEEQYRAVLAIQERTLGEEHPDSLSSRDNLAKALRSQRKSAEAVELSREALAIRERILGAEHRDVFLTCHNLAIALANRGENEEALLFAKRGFDGFTKSLGADSPHTEAARKLVTLLESR